MKYEIGLIKRIRRLLSKNLTVEEFAEKLFEDDSDTTIDYEGKELSYPEDTDSNTVKINWLYAQEDLELNYTVLYKEDGNLKVIHNKEGSEIILYTNTPREHEKCWIALESFSNLPVIRVG